MEDLTSFDDVAGCALSLPSASDCKQTSIWFGALEIGLSALLTFEVWIQPSIFSPKLNMVEYIYIYQNLVNHKEWLSGSKKFKSADMTGQSSFTNKNWSISPLLRATMTA